MTTDTVPKLSTATSEQGWKIGGMAKGAGMLAPALATMLVVITTDAGVSDLDAHLRAATSVSFDRLDSDGCTSTNDTVILMSSGSSGIKADEQEFQNLLVDVCMDLARQLMKDAEGASHEIAIEVHGAATESDALEVGRSIARNNLFKTAIYGNDPNWGRILAAIGTTSAKFDPYDIDVEINGVRVSSKGGPDEDRSLVDLSRREVLIRVGLNAGQELATILTNDLTKEYVIENSEYSS
jgi:glutamate N-acetyltransferase/amino-acid N-acetyltransferase